MNFVNAIIPKQEYKDKDSLGSKIIVHFNPVEKMEMYIVQKLQLMNIMKMK